MTPYEKRTLYPPRYRDTPELRGLYLIVPIEIWQEGDGLTHSIEDTYVNTGERWEFLKRTEEISESHVSYSDRLNCDICGHVVRPWESESRTVEIPVEVE